MGIGGDVGLEYGLKEQLNLDVVASYHRFAFDEARFFSRLKLNGPGYSVSGGTGTILSLVGQVHYQVPGYEWIRPSFFGGLGFLVSARSAATVDYSGLKESMSSHSSLVPCFPFGMRLAKAWTEKIDVLLDFQYFIGLSKAQDVNSNFTAIRVGVAIAP